MLIPWYLYQYCGDTRVLADHYAGMKQYVDFMTVSSHDYLVNHGLGDWVPAKTDHAGDGHLQRIFLRRHDDRGPGGRVAG